MSTKKALIQRNSAKRRSLIARVRPPMRARSRSRTGPVNTRTSAVGGSMTRTTARTSSGTAAASDRAGWYDVIHASRSSSPFDEGACQLAAPLGADVRGSQLEECARSRPRRSWRLSRLAARCASTSDANRKAARPPARTHERRHQGHGSHRAVGIDEDRGDHEAEHKARRDGGRRGEEPAGDRKPEASARGRNVGEEAAVGRRAAPSRDAHHVGDPAADVPSTRRNRRSSCPGRSSRRRSCRAARTACR